MKGKSFGKDGETGNGEQAPVVAEVAPSDSLSSTSALQDLFNAFGGPGGEPVVPVTQSLEPVVEPTAAGASTAEPVAALASAPTTPPVQTPPQVAAPVGEPAPEVLSLITALGVPPESAPVFQEFMTNFANAVVQQTLSQMPPVVGNLVNHQMQQATMRNKFFTDYPDLRAHEDVVGLVAVSVEGKNPGKKFQDLADTIAKEARQKLNIVHSAPSLPAAPGAGGDITPPTVVTGTQSKAMSDMLSFSETGR